MSCLCDYDKKLFTAIFLLAFFVFLRVSEYTQLRHNLKKEAVILLASGVKITFSFFKFSRNRTTEIILPAIHSTLCPVMALRAYISS